MRRFVRSLATLLLLAFAGATIEAPVASAWAQGASKQTRARRRRPRAEPPYGSRSPLPPAQRPRPRPRPMTA
jgi:hypothetical protein